MSTDAFPRLISRWEIVHAWLDEIRAWLPEYLAAFERQRALEVGATPRRISYVARHAGALRGGETPPAIVAWPAGALDHTVDPDTGTVVGTLQLGLAIVAGGAGVEATGEVLHRLVAAVTGLLDRHTTVAGHAQMLERVDEDYELIIESGREQRLAGAVLLHEAHGVVLGHRSGGPPPGSRPRTDPTSPWPPPPTAERAHVELRPQPMIHDPEDTL